MKHYNEYSIGPKVNNANGRGAIIVPLQTLGVGMKAARTLYYAEEQAQRIGWPMNTSVTILLAEIGVSLEEAGPKFRKILNQRFRNWIERPAKPHKKAIATWSYGFENSREGVAFTKRGGDQNVHVHWVVHIPKERRKGFEIALRGWIDEVARTQFWKEQVIEIRDIVRPGDVSKYPIKGASKTIAAHFGLKPENVTGQGLIIGRRSGTTKNIGPSARKEWDAKIGKRRWVRQ